ncbi:hypothetical protein KIPB_001050 [Kipferlia bialata]|uniref:Tubulin-folding cofactor D ARM repeats domain-containing protein n=1 Tax=Kipferlia bialata TaxID=797122 RepID=A0A9K3GFH3_9EUKA|nr:hypothetical protein KIPB_001050 [Kipferlia bialata]|eukprot:g1050.t1
MEDPEAALFEHTFVKEWQELLTLQTRILADAQVDGSGNNTVSDSEALAKEAYSDSEALAKEDTAGRGFRTIISYYTEQPQLLDPHLPALFETFSAYMVNEITKAVQEGEPVIANPYAYRCLYTLITVRGYKKTVNLLPNDPELLTPCLALLNRHLAASDSNGLWEVEYVLFLWLSLLVQAPFSLSSIDTDASHDTPLGDRLLALGLRQHSTGELMSLIDWVVVRLTRHETEPSLSLVACLDVVNAVLKIGQRDVLLPVSDRIPIGVLTPLLKSKNATIRKYTARLAQRLGLLYVKPRPVTWAYSRGARSLAANLSRLKDTKDKTQSKGTAQEGERGRETGDKGKNAVSVLPGLPPVTTGGLGALASLSESDIDDLIGFDVPEAFDQCVEALLVSLCDTDIVVRQTSAKGLGRVMARLPRVFAKEVLDAVLSIFSPAETPAAWHGACLSLAEMARRGLILPDALPDAMPPILEALTFSRREGHKETGAYVRDAGAYCVWAFSRAYSPQDMQPYVEALGAALVSVSCFDREVNCRRAANAAYQECVGRLGTLPHGIEVIQLADFLSLGLKREAFTRIAPGIAALGDQAYLVPLVSHLLDHSVVSWDSAIRRLAAKVGV